MSTIPVEKPVFELGRPLRSVRELREYKAGQKTLAHLVESANTDATFTTLDTLSREASQNPSLRPVFDDLIDTTAELLLDEVAAVEETKHKYDPGLGDVLSALRAWDMVRDEATAKLVTHVLDHFKGSSQSALAHAYISARDTKLPDGEVLPFDRALDEYNQQQRQAA